MLLIDFINVGYGDSILLREMEDGSAAFSMLVDCGNVDTGVPYPGSRRTAAAAYLQALGVRQLDLLVLSHLHLDHIGGLPALLPLPIAEVWSNYLPPQSLQDAVPALASPVSPDAGNLVQSLQLFLPALRNLQARGTCVRLQQQSAPAMPLTARLFAQIDCAPAALYARQDAAIYRLLADADGSELDALDGYINQSSIRLLLRYCGHSICLPGDATAPFFQQTAPPACDILKVPHHGHADSLRLPLLEALRPDFAVISVSNDRRDDCPSKSALQLLQARVPNILFTDAVSPPGLPATEPRPAVRLQVDDAGVRKVEIQ